MSIELSKDDREEAIAALQSYSDEHMDDRLGNIAAGALLDFFLEEIAPSVYNRGVSDVRDRLQARIMDIDVEVHEEEFPASRRRGRK